MFLSFLLLLEERSVIRSRNKTLSGISSRCGQTPENTSATQYRYQFRMVIWKLCIFFQLLLSILYSLGRKTKQALFLNAILTKTVWGITVGGWSGSMLCSSSLSLLCLAQICYPGYIWTLSEIKFCFFFHRKKGVFLLRKILDKALVPFSVRCQYVFVRLTAQQDKCPSCTRGKGQPIIHSL